MAWPQQPDVPYPADDTDDAPAPGAAVDAAHPAEDKPRVLRLRLAVWDVTCTAILLVLLLLLATATSWPHRLYGFLKDVCVGETCGPVPFGVDYYIHPLVWGGIGAAIAAAVLGPIVSLLKGWYMSFWPVLALAVIMISAVAGSLLTTFSARFWL
ncbi:hypothetical protein [Mycobacterium sp. Marseille-P9652]|uniref:hypothetical protein n=1 Tax=Mycobacterium sp. Marseille-P9652 TaxID=2654950 RepID=UPI0012E704F0|nr:hypothetical protein [Mycobacterium sp. Marseille-P9652]